MPFVRLIDYTCYRRDIWPEIPARTKNIFGGRGSDLPFEDFYDYFSKNRNFCPVVASCEGKRRPLVDYLI